MGGKQLSAFEALSHRNAEHLVELNASTTKASVDASPALTTLSANLREVFGAMGGFRFHSAFAACGFTGVLHLEREEII